MQKEEITENDFEQILNDKLGLAYWEFQLGVGFMYEGALENTRFSAPYPKMGRKLWKAFKFELYEILCLRDSKAPREWVNELISGDIRNLVIGICSAVTAKYEVSLGIAVPLAALIIKTGILNYCAIPAEKSKKSVAEILKSKNHRKSK